MKRLTKKDIRPPTTPKMATLEKHGFATIIVGLRWGDESKGKVAHLLVEKLNAKIGVRHGGGGNSGHTVYPFKGQDVKVALNHLPGCVVSDNGIPCLARGMVIDPKGLLREMGNLRALGFAQELFAIKIDRMAHVVMPWHFILDDPTGKIGSTKKGIGPAYTAKIDRTGIRINDLLNAGTLQTKIQEILGRLNLPGMDANKIVDEYLALGLSLKPLIADVSKYLRNALNNGCDVIAEGHQGLEIGIESIEYPYVTSSDTSAAAFCAGAGVPMRYIKNIYGVLKAYDTSVGVRPGFLAKQDNEIGEKLRQRGKEYGATTGRPRDCGWLDVATTAEAIDMNGITGVMMNKLDIFSGFSKVCICVGYSKDGKIIDTLPVDIAERSTYKPVYKEFDGWDKDITGVQDIAKLPKNARAFINAIEKFIGVPIIGIGTGPHPEDMIWMHGY